MKNTIPLLVAAMALVLASSALAGEISLESAPPVVVRTVPVAGSENVDPALGELQVTFSKSMQDGSWSWSTWSEENFPETTGKPRFLGDGRTCVLPVKLQPGRFYAAWLNTQKFENFKDAGGRSAVPYLLTFKTRGHSDPQAPPVAASAPAVSATKLNEDQRLVLEWTDRQFRSFFDARTFDGWSEKERAELETRLLDTLKGPQTREYYQAINTLAALRSGRGLPALRAIAFDRRDKDNRDRWMAIRALGNIGDKMAVPELIHLVYHGNVNTRWWAQISLVRLTEKNFGTDWKAWGAWWNDSRGEPAFDPDIIRWWSGQAEPEKLTDSLEESDRKFLEKLRPPAGAPAAGQTK
jgi:RNA polymerase sigma-70 factor (ECF subfamily)